MKKIYIVYDQINTNVADKAGDEVMHMYDFLSALGYDVALFPLKLDTVFNYCTKHEVRHFDFDAMRSFMSLVERGGRVVVDGLTNTAEVFLSRLGVKPTNIKTLVNETPIRTVLSSDVSVADLVHYGVKIDTDVLTRLKQELNKKNPA